MIRLVLAYPFAVVAWCCLCLTLVVVAVTLTISGEQDLPDLLPPGRWRRQVRRWRVGRVTR